MSSGDWDVTNTGSFINLRDIGKMRCLFIGSVQDFMPCECSFNVQRKAHNGSPKPSEIKVPRFVCVAVKCYDADLQNLQPMK